MQIEENNLYHPINVLSKNLSLTQHNYSTIERDVLALVAAVRCFKPYLNDNLVVFSNHQPLSFIYKMAIKNQRLL